MIESVGQYLATKGVISRLSPASRKVLMTVFDNPNSTSQELAKKCFISENSISTSLVSLKEKGIISSYRTVTDMRKTHWYICDSNIKDTLMINDRQILKNEYQDVHI